MPRDAGQPARGAVAAGDTLPDDPPAPVMDCPLVWIEVQMFDEEDNPVPSLRYVVTDSGGTPHEGNLDEFGVGRVDGIPPGNCKIEFPDLDIDIWKRK